MWRLLLVLVFLPVGAVRPHMPPPAMPLPEPPRVVAEVQPPPLIAPPTSTASSTRLVVDCSPPDVDQPGLAAVCVYKLAPGEP